MASTTSHSTFAPYQPSPLARTTSPFKDPRTPPRTPLHSAKLWDEYERRAVESTKTACVTPSRLTPKSQRLSSGTLLDIVKSYDPYSPPRVPDSFPKVPVSSPRVSAGAASAQFDFGFQMPTPQMRTSETVSTSLATCKTCAQSITSLSGICEKCKKTIILSSTPRIGETTPPLTPACRNFASTDLPKLQRQSASGTNTPTSSSPKRRPHRTPSTQLELPIRLTSLRPPPSQDNNTFTPPPRKCSLTDPNEPFLRLQISRKPVPHPREVLPSSPITPPSTSHSSHTSTSTSNTRTRPPSLANVTTPPQYAPYPRHNSATPSELSALYPYISATTTSPPSVCRASYSLQNTTSAWDDSDSENEEKGLVSYWRGRKWRGSRSSLGNTNTNASNAGSMRRGSETRRDSKVEETRKEEVKRKRRGAFVRVISCGCHD